ncbi:PEP-CTERM sorting domain-containing protein [Allocoleopsis sp.]|uniref:PEP-CTERM sorting domain-containing protein n=1 Tax=Allocoleopsis sp. TaxID=3088169 RepID=UPI002FD72473
MTKPWKIYVQSAGKTSSLADLPASTSYFNQTQPVLNAIAAGNFVTGISFLDSTQLNQLGLSFNQFGATGSQTIGFSFDRTALPAGNFIANIFAECANDGMVLLGETQSVPEPLTLLGSLVGAGLIGFHQRNKRNPIG